VHPTNPDHIYAGAADIKGIVSSDGWQSWSIVDSFHKAVPNSIYGFAFDPALPNRVFIASAKWHDWPSMWYANPLNVSMALHAFCSNTSKGFKQGKQHLCNVQPINGVHQLQH
jgi:hypothetical protein